MWSYKTTIAQQKARRKQHDLPVFRLDKKLNCSPFCLVVIVVCFMSAGD